MFESQVTKTNDMRFSSVPAEHVPLDAPKRPPRYFQRTRPHTSPRTIRIRVWNARNFGPIHRT
jgi:hypothetical protein